MATNNTPLISIIVPCFNSGLYLAETLESLIMQSYTNWECIIIDDSSSDNSVAIANSYQDRYPSAMKVVSNTGKGACAARNFGISLSSGSYIKFLDSDDALFNEDVLGKQVAFCENYSYDIGYGDEYYYQDVFEQHNLIKKRGKAITNPELFYDNFPITTNFIIRTDILKKLRWNENLKSGQEFFLLFQCFTREARFGYQPTPVAKIRVHDSVHRISNKSKQKYVEQLLDVVREMKADILITKQSDQNFIKTFKNQLLKSSFLALRHQDSNAARSIIKDLKSLPFSAEAVTSCLIGITYTWPKAGYFFYRVVSRMGFNKL